MTPESQGGPTDNARRDDSPRLVQCGDGSRFDLDLDVWTITFRTSVRFPERRSLLALLSVDEAEHLISALTYWVGQAREEGA